MEGKEHHGQQDNDCVYNLIDQDKKDWSLVMVKEELEEVKSENLDAIRSPVMTVATNKDEACKSGFDLYSSIEVVKEELSEYEEYQDKNVKVETETQLDEACSSQYKIHDPKVLKNVVKRPLKGNDQISKIFTLLEQYRALILSGKSIVSSMSELIQLSAKCPACPQFFWGKADRMYRLLAHIVSCHNSDYQEIAMQAIKDYAPLIRHIRTVLRQEKNIRKRL